MGWPPLAWIAKCAEAGPQIVVAHGCQVETQEDWFIEGVWAGPFEEGGIHRTDLIFGSGGRISNEGIAFVSAGSTLERLVSCRIGENTYISNSLVALCATLELSVDPVSPDYYFDFRSIINGLDKYKDNLQTTRGPVRLTYFRNLHWDGRSLTVKDKLHGDRTFADFEEYKGFLLSSLTAIERNMRDVRRKWPYTPIGTISAGYDSPTVAALARDIGNTEVLTFQHGRGGGSDSGELIASQLGLKSIPLDRTLWRRYPLSEVPFIAADAYGIDAHFVAARPYLQQRVLLTGFQGGKVWGTNLHDLTPDLVRGDPSGLGMTDWRLSVGFVNCAVPFFGARNVAQIHRISNTEEMKPWSIGGDYDRPICRRILEAAGVERGLFGTEKRASSVALWNTAEEEFLPEESMQSFLPWLRQHVPDWLRRKQAPPFWKLQAHRAARRLRGKQPYPPAEFYFFHLFPWALDIAKRRYIGMGPVFDVSCS